MELKNNYKYCLIRARNNEVVLFDETDAIGDSKIDNYLTDVSVHIDDKGLLHISGKEHEWHCVTERTNVNDLKEGRPEERYIKKSGGCKMLGLKPYEYVLGWYAYFAKNDVSFIMNNYKIKIQK